MHCHTEYESLTLQLSDRLIVVIYARFFQNDKMAVAIHAQERVLFQQDGYIFLIKSLLDQTDSGDFCDVCLRLNGRRFYAHKAVLAATSPYFRSMFTSQMKERKSPEVNLTRSLALESDESFKIIIKFLYSGEILLTRENVEDILRISDFLLLDDVKSYCHDFYLKHGNLNLSNCLRVSVLGQHHNMPQLAKIAGDILQSRFHDYFVYSEDILEVPKPYLISLLKDKDLVRFASQDLYKTILRWIEFDPFERRQYKTELLSQLPERSVVTSFKSTTSARKSKHSNDSNYVVLVSSKSELDWKFMSPPFQQENTLQDNYVPTEPVVFGIVHNSTQKFIKMMIYRPNVKLWFQLKLNMDQATQNLPPRLSVCSATLGDGNLYMFLSNCLPYPADMLEIQILKLELETGLIQLLTFYHRHRTAECCQTTVMDDPTVPPAMVYVDGYLCLIGNMAGTGQVYLCDVTSESYMCYQLPQTRFVSQARALAKGEDVFIWCRHRFGPEDRCISKEVSFLVFNVIDKSFTTDVPTPTDISYGQFGDLNMMCLKDNYLVINIPGKKSLKLNELNNQWETCNYSLPPYTGKKGFVDLPYQGYEVCTLCNDKVYVLQNPAAYTTSLMCLEPGARESIPLCPPPSDGISLATSGQLAISLLERLSLVTSFDESFTKIIHSRVSLLDYDTDESVKSSLTESDDEEYDGYEYDDDDMYGYYGGFNF